MSNYDTALLALNPLWALGLGEAAGTNADDSTANNRDGTIAGGVTLGSPGLLLGDPATAFTFNGTSGKVTIPWGAWMDVTHITLIAWIKTSATGVRLIIDRDGGSNPRPWQFRHNGGTLEFLKIGGTAATASQATSINDNVRHMVAATYDGANVKLYKDGVLIKTQAAVAGSLQPNPTANIALGVNRSPGENAWFSGVMQKTAMFDYALTGSDIANLFSLGVSPNIAGGLATETDTALAGTVGTGTDVAGGLGTETDTALAGTTEIILDPIYTITLKVGTHEFTITSDCTIDPDDPIQVLDGLTAGWEIPESGAWPAQPDPVEATIRLWTDDVANLADVNIGTPMSIVAVDQVGDVFLTAHGRVGEMTARPVRRPSGTFMLYTLPCVDYTVDYAELPIVITEEWPAESADDRFARIAAAITAAGGAPLDPPADTGSAAFKALAAGTTTAGALVADHLRQIAVDGTYGPERYLLTPVVVADELDHFECVLLERTVDAALLPGTFDVVDGLLTLVFPDDIADGLVDACDLDLETPWKRLKYRAANQVTVTADGYTAIVRRPGPPVKLELSSTLTDVDAIDRMAQLYLPDVDESNGWVADTFTLYAWRTPSAITPAWFPDHRADPASPAVYVMPIAVVGIPPELNLAGNIAYAGQLSRVQLTIADQKTRVEFALRRQLPLGIGDDAASWDWVGTEFPTITWDDVDPDMSWYEARLARST